MRIALLVACLVGSWQFSLAYAAATAVKRQSQSGQYRLDLQKADGAEIAAALAQASGRTLSGAPIVPDQRWSGQFQGSLNDLLRRFLDGQGHVLTADGRILIASGVPGQHAVAQGPPPAAPRALPPSAITPVRAQAPSRAAGADPSGARVQGLLRGLVRPRAQPTTAQDVPKGNIRVRGGRVEIDPEAQAQIAAMARQAQADATALAAALQAANAGLPPPPPPLSVSRAGPG